MSIRVVTPPAGEPVTLAEAKLWLRIDDDITDQDAMILGLIAAMRAYAENLTGRAFVERTLELRLDCFPARAIELPHPPLQSVSSISYQDVNGNWQSLLGSPSEFQVDLYREPGRVLPLEDETWPTTSGELDVVRIEYICGYPSLSQIPAQVKLWMRARIATLNEQREQLVTGTIVTPLPRDFCDGMLDDLVLGSRLFG